MRPHRPAPLALAVLVTLPVAAGAAPLTRSAFATSPPVSEPTPITTANPGVLLAEPDTAVCTGEHPSCIGLPREPIAATNANPLRLIVQLATARSSGPLTADAFDVRVPFAPEGAPSIALLDCPTCFETTEDGTYALWLGPATNWAPGSYFVRIGLRDASAVLPTLARFEVPAGGPSQPGCENAPPVAAIAGGETGILVFGAPGQVVNVVLDGTLSYDPDQLPLDRWIWSCGNGRAPIPQGNGSKVACSYIVQSVPVTYTGTLNVSDRGTGEIDPNSGTWRCQKHSPAATIAVSTVPYTAAATSPAP